MKMHPKTKAKRLETQRIATPATPSASQSHSLFPIGSQVEVSSDEEGFQGAWYSATVIPFPSSEQQLPEHGTIFVEYKSLLSDENGSALLREFVKVEFLRPKPPADANDKICFEVDDVVDAFYQDGWWCGVVTQVLSKNKYIVFFVNPPDEIEFHSSDLRFHKNWVHGKWLLPPKQRMRNLNFSPGTAVEVNIDPDNLRDVWFPATFIRKPASDSFLVEYQSSEDVGLQKVAVDSFHIRPSPPNPSNKAFNLLEKVDAFYNFHWLSGVVTKILADGRYIVYFKDTKKEKELSHADLRLHMEWNNGKWIHFSQDTSNSEKRSDYTINGGNMEKTSAPSEGSDAVKNNATLDRSYALNFKCGQRELTPDTENSSYSSAMPSKKRTKQTSVNGNASYSRPSRRTNEELASDMPLSSETCKSRTQQMQGSRNGTSVYFDSPVSGIPLQSNLKHFEDCSLPSDQTVMKVDSGKHSASRKRGRPPKQRALLSGDALGETVDQTPNKSDVMKPLGPIVIGLTHDGKMIESLSESSSQNKKVVEDEEKNVHSSADHESLVSNGSVQQKEGEVANLKRKRGRPPKLPFRVGSPNTKEAVAEEKKDDASDAKDDDEKHFPINEVQKPISIVEPSGISGSSPTDHHSMQVTKFTDQIKLLSDMLRLSTRSTSRKQGRKQRKVSTESVMMDLNECVKPIALRKGRKQKPAKLVELQSEDAVDNSRMRAIKVFKNGVAGDIDRVVGGTSSNFSDDDRPLSAWLEEAQPPTTDPRNLLGGTIGQSGESGKRREEIKTSPVGLLEKKKQDNNDNSSPVNISQEKDKNDEMRLQIQSTAIVAVEDQDMPFVKNSLIWKLIENMEVLKQIPQKPHFRPLYNCKEECREGLAIGSMVTFTSLVERISRSRFSDPKSLLDGYMEALVDLEELGFNVAPVREQLNRLISIKGKYEQAQNMSNEIESQIMEHNFEKSKIDEEVVGLDKKIAELMEQRSLVVSKKERKDAQIALLRSSVDVVKGVLESAEVEFEKETTSLW